MKIKIPNTLHEPLALRWNEMLSMEDHKNLVHKIRRALHEMCERGEAAGLIPGTPISMMIGILQSTAEAAGADEVWIKFDKYRRGNRADGKVIMIRYTVGFELPGNPDIRHGWLRNLPA